MTDAHPTKKQPFALIIEDEDDIAYVFAIALHMAGFETEIVRDGVEALERLKRLTPDILILDLHLPHISGEEVLTWVRAEKRLSQMRVIIASANPRWASRLEQHGDLVLLKPVSFQQLRDLAARLRPRN